MSRNKKQFIFKNMGVRCPIKSKIMIIVKQQKKKDWIDEAGNTVMYNQLTTVEKVNEESCYKIAKEAERVFDKLVKLKRTIVSEVQKCIDAFHQQYKGKKTVFKGNYTIFNFDQSLKIEVSVSQPIRFDDMGIQAAKAKLDEFLDEGITTKNQAVKQMVLSAFETSGGKMDVKKIMALKRYAERINSPLYDEAMQMIDQAIRRPDTATYYRVAVKNSETGKFEYIKLSLADIV
jgi:hypothetical protein